MAMRFGLLALLAGEPSHGYELKTALERVTGGSWAINIGQVYSTLQRLERDRLIVADAGEPSAGARDRTDYRITPTGSVALDQWFSEPELTDAAPRDGLTATRPQVGGGAAGNPLLGNQQRGGPPGGFGGPPGGFGGPPGGGGGGGGRGR